MPNKKKVIKGLEKLRTELGYGLPDRSNVIMEYLNSLSDAISLLKEQENEYEKGFNDAMLGKQELMYEGTDGKWHKKDW